MAMRTVFLLVLIVLSVVPAVTQDGGGIGFGPQIGIYKAQDADVVRVMGGAALRLKFSDAIGVEASINYRAEEYNNGAVKVTSWPIMVTGLLYPIPVVYGAIGAGWYNTTIDYDFPAGFLGGPGTTGSETHQEFGWHFGGGVELPLGSVAKLVGDIRYVFLDYEFESFPGSNDVNSNFYVITVGLLFGL
ncbi:MAG: outer membrane beta-barrel protein [Bacteroidota bacterium]